MFRRGPKSPPVGPPPRHPVRIHRGREPLEGLSTHVLGVELERCGIQGSPTKVHKVESVVLSGKGHEQFEPTSEDIGNLLDSLIGEHFFG